MGSYNSWKVAAVICALIPICFLLFFAIRAGANGIGHFGQLIPIVLLAIFGWYTPRQAGFVLIFGALALMIIYAMSFYNTTTIAALALVEIIVFVPLLASGYCFLKAE